MKQNLLISLNMPLNTVLDKIYIAKLKNGFSDENEAESCLRNITETYSGIYISKCV